MQVGKGSDFLLSSLLSLLCFVARRLGVAMTLLDARNQVTTIVVEDGTKPESWTEEDGRTWSRFYYTPITGVDGRGRVIESGEATEALAKTEQNPNAEPGLPLDMLAAFAEDLMGKFGSTLTWGTDEAEEDILRTKKDEPDGNGSEGEPVKKRARESNAQTTMMAFFEKPLEESTKNEFDLKLIR